MISIMSSQIFSMFDLDIHTVIAILVHAGGSGIRGMKQTCKIMYQLIHNNIILRALGYHNLSHCARFNDILGYEFMIASGKFTSKDIVRSTLFGNCEKIIKIAMSLDICTPELTFRAAYMGDKSVIKQLYETAFNRRSVHSNVDTTPRVTVTIMTARTQRQSVTHDDHPAVQSGFRECKCMHGDNGTYHYIQHDDIAHAILSEQEYKKFLLGRSDDINVPPVMLIAAIKSHYDVIRLMVDTNIFSSYGLYHMAKYFVKLGDLEGFRFIADKSPASINGGVMRTIILENSPVCLKMALPIYVSPNMNGYFTGQCVKKLCSVAINAGSSECLSTMISIYRYFERFFSELYYEQNISVDCVIVLHKAGYIWDTTRMILKSLESHNSILLKYVCENSCLSENDYDYTNALIDTSDECRAYFLAYLGIV